MGSPRVFHTAPPQPASNARITWSPQFAGGPEASQNGFGQRIFPAKSVVRSAMVDSQMARDADPGALSIRDRVDHLAAAVDAIATGENLRFPRLPGLAIHAGQIDTTQPSLPD